MKRAVPAWLDAQMICCQIMWQPVAWALFETPQFERWLEIS